MARVWLAGVKLARFLAIAIVFAIASFAHVRLAHASTGITYQGRILKPDGSPLEGSIVNFRLQIRTPGSQNCLMFEEQQTLDMRNSGGNFSLTMNDGSGTRTDLTGLGLDRVFANRVPYTFDPTTCSIGSSFSPSADDGRKLVVYFKDETMASWEPMPAQNINFVPHAIEAMQVAGYSAQNLLRFAESDGTLVNTSPLNNAQYTELLALVNGTSNTYEKAGKLAGGSLPALAAGQVLGWSGTAWTAVDPSSSSASVLKDPDGGANTVTFQVDPLIAANYTVTWPATVGAANQVLVNDGTGKLSWGAGPAASQWTTTGSNIYYNTGSVGIGTSTPQHTLHISRTDATPLTLVENTDSTTAQYPGFVARNYKGTTVNTGFPKMQFIAARGSKASPDALQAGDHLGMIEFYGSRDTAGNSSRVGSILVSSEANFTTASNPTSMRFATTASGSNFASEKMRITPAGDVGIGTSTPQAMLDVAGAIRVADSTTCASVNAGSIRYNTGNISFCNGTAWQTLGLANSGITALTGDVTATGSGSVAATVATVGTSSAANIHSAELLANAATSAGTINAIVKRDPSGSFVAGGATITSALKLKDGAAGGEVSIAAPTGFTNYALTLPTTAGTNGHLLTTNGSGALSWTNPSSLSPWTVSGSDIYRASGNVGIGTTNPTAALQVNTGTDNFKVEPGNSFGLPALSGSGSNGAGISFLSTPVLQNGVTMQIRDSGNDRTTTLAHNNNADFRITTSVGDISLMPNSGNVGIGTSTPLAALEVVGSIVAGSGGNGSLSFVSGNTALSKSGNAYSVGGTNANNYLVLRAEGGEKVRIDRFGDVGIGTTAPRAGLDVSNGSAVFKAAVADATAAVDFGTGNIHYTTANCGAFTMTNMKDGGTYTFVVQGATSATCSFTAYPGDTSTTAHTIHMPPGHGATVASTHTLYTMMVVGTHVYVSWILGY